MEDEMSSVDAAFVAVFWSMLRRDEQEEGDDVCDGGFSCLLGAPVLTLGDDDKEITGAINPNNRMI